MSSRSKAFSKVGWALACVALCGLVFSPGLAAAQGGVAAAPSKDETVRVAASAEGVVERIEVTDVLKNPQHAAELADRSILEGIEAADDAQSFVREGDACVWSTDGADVTYTGVTTAPLPVTMSITYSLDGKPLAPGELAGKSGHVAIAFRFQNASSNDVSVNGRVESIYTPFSVLTALMFDGATMTNVTVDNGRIIEDGDTSIVAGFAMPGLRESLGDMGEELDAPDGFTVEGDASGFEMKSGLTLVSAGLLSDFDVGDLGAEATGEAAEALDVAARALVAGSRELGSGIAALSGATSALAEGSARLAAGLESATGKLPEIEGGAGALDAAAGSLSTAAGGLYGGASTLREALLQAQAVSAQVSANLDALAGGALTGLLEDAAREAEADAAAVRGVGEGLSLAKTDVERASAGIEAALETLDRADVQNAAAREALQDAQAALSGTQAALAQAVRGADGLSSSALDRAVSALSAADLASLAENAHQLHASASQLVAQMGDESSAGTLVGGAYAVKAGAESLKTALATFTDGSRTLVGGVSAIVSAAIELAGGARQLDDGAAALTSGSASLTEGLEAFESQGVRVLADELDERFGGLIDRMDALAAASRAYDTFAGKSPETAGNVKFVIETAAVAKP